jgi:hypothetical protein
MNRLPHLTDSELSTLTNALHVAAEIYDKDAATESVTPRFREQFERQAIEARALADKLEALSEDA